MTDTVKTFTAFSGDDRVAAGDRDAVKAALAARGNGGELFLIFEDGTGRTVDWHPVGGLVERPPREVPATAPAGNAGRGRPKLGVVAREVTLLPRHWDWLAAQPGGASVTLRRLVDEARRAGADTEALRQARDALYHVLSGLGGDRPGFEEAVRALYAGDRDRLATLIADWPADIRAYALAHTEAAFAG
ncbi:DUF2239 family protein [Segnochrobactrum spirostomi]|uniref:DUF2239 family protein n=1 Tax=Segnochrobactrum spirostomi TaxID=2608987 RepID=A0A6A7Y043_9HYPH|nr:DUF2239 family protein [Segnochrobactrum spirostomi]MQT12105.1 DUF2239 family protein [Segnochrobactrum spirostomi]